jgi:hypothetical protein
MSPVLFTSSLMIETVAIESSSLDKVHTITSGQFFKSNSAMRPSITTWASPAKPIGICYEPIPRAPTSTIAFETSFPTLGLRATVSIRSTKNTKPVGSIDPPGFE